MKVIKMAGGLPKKSLAVVPASTQELWLGESSWRQKQTSRGENLKSYMTATCFPPLAPSIPKGNKKLQWKVKQSHRGFQIFLDHLYVATEWEDMIYGFQ